MFSSTVSLTSHGTSFFGSTHYGGDGGGLRTPIIGSIYLTVLALIFVVPLGVGAAIYLSEYAPRGPLNQAIRYGTDTVAGIPSIIFGMFGVAFFLMILLAGRMCLLAGCLYYGLSHLPLYGRRRRGGN